MNKLHIPHPCYTTPKNGKPFVPLCGAFTVAEMADKIEEVTCKNCLRKLKSTAEKAVKKLDRKKREIDYE